MAKRAAAEHHDRYFQVHHFMAKTDAWRALTAPARAVYIQIGLRYNGGNNGKIPYSVRDAASECILAINTASRAFKELIALGFIEETRHGGLSRKTRVASEWRLTAFKCNLTNSPKSCLFMQRGEQARAYRQSRSRPQAGRRLSQTTISQEPEPVSNDGRDCIKRRSVDSKLYQTTISQNSECLKRRSVKPVFGGSPVSNDGRDCIKRRSVDSKLYQTTISQNSECLKRRSVKPVFGGSPVSNDGTLIIYHPIGASGAALLPPADDAPTPAQPSQPNTKKSARKPKGRSDDLTVVQPPSHGPNEPRRPADEGEAAAPHVAARPKWTKPIIRELFGAEAIMRRAEIALEQQQ
jgi:hypothetical protein